MWSYEPSVFVDPLGYQPVEFLDIPPMSESPHEPRADALVHVFEPT
jgi:hypothetical protein